MVMGESLKLTWYGRCCFLMEYKGKRVLFDPYDTYCNVDVGIIEADVLITSSTWHDHGHIGASPKAHIYSYPGKYENNGTKIFGVKAKEDRGSPTVVFNVILGPFSITNFADFGPEQKNDFDKNLTLTQRAILKNTNIAFIRPSIKGDEMQKTNEHNECVLDYSEPSIIFPEHYFPKSFIEEQVPESTKQSFLTPLIVVNEMIDIFSNYSLKEVDGYEVVIKEEHLSRKEVIKFLRMHDQVKYKM